MSSRLTLFDLLSPEPIEVEGVGQIRKVKLSEIGKIKFINYSTYINMLGISLESLIDTVGLRGIFDEMSEQEKAEIGIFDVIVLIPDLIQLYLTILNFFMVGEVVFDQNKRVFCVLTEEISVDEEGSTGDKKTTTGVIDRTNYCKLFELILRTQCIEVATYDTQKARGKKAMALLKKIEEGRKKQGKQKAKDTAEDMSIGNIISKLCTYCPSVNMVNVWDMTVYQLYNQFRECNMKNIHDVHAMNYSFCGGEFDFTGWFKSVN